MSAPLGNQGVSAKQYATSTTPLRGSADGTIATLAGGEILVIQNLSATPLCVRLGAGATVDIFHYIVPACNVQDDGSSPPFYVDNWIGIVSVIKQSGTTRYMQNKLTN